MMKTQTSEFSYDNPYNSKDQGVSQGHYVSPKHFYTQALIVGP